MTAGVKRIGRMRLLDMHAHLSCFMEKNGRKGSEAALRALAEQELALRKDSGVATFFSSGTLAEWKFLQPYRGRGEVLLSFGIHPWYADGGDGALLKRTGCSLSQTAYEGRGAQQAQTERKSCSVQQAKWTERKSRSAQQAKQTERKSSTRREIPPEEALREAYARCDAVGEIGMDCVWCSVPLDVQRRVFERQLQIAADLKKPVILHTKGMEREIAAMIRDFPEPVCVHWYSGDLQSFESFLASGCYFTLGPDLAEAYRGREALCGERETAAPGEATDKTAIHGESADQAAAQGETAANKAAADPQTRLLYDTMLREIPPERLFVETDGVSSIAWMRGTPEAPLAEIPRVLAANMDVIAKRKNMQGEELYGRIWDNLQEFFRRTGESPTVTRSGEL